MRSLLRATPYLALAAVLAFAAPAAAEEGTVQDPAAGQECTPLAFDLTAPAQQEALAEATFTPAGPAELAQVGEHLKLSSRLFEVASTDGVVSLVRVWCSGFCPDGREPSGCDPLPSGQCSFCGCGGAGVCTCNRIIFE